MQTDQLRRFDVQLGFTRIFVYAATEADAIAEARRQLSRESPRLWDIIFGLEEKRFTVCAID